MNRRVLQIRHCRGRDLCCCFLSHSIMQELEEAVSPKHSSWVQASVRKHSSVLWIDLQHWGGEWRNSDTSAFFFCQKVLGNCNCSYSSEFAQGKLCTCFLIQPICSTSAKLCLRCVQKIQIVPQDYWCCNSSFASKAKMALQAGCADCRI